MSRGPGRVASQSSVRIRLFRVPTLRAFRAAIVERLPLGDLDRARSTAVIVPTRSAARLLQRGIEDSLGDRQAAVLPDFVTRREWYARLVERLDDPPPTLPDVDREVLMEAAAHAAITDGATPPFHLRSPLVGEMVALYDAIARQRQSVADFERLVLEPLTAEAESGGDAGAERMLRQTRFLAATFAGYESRRDAHGAADEHTVRAVLSSTPMARPYRTLVVTVADHPRDGNGLWSADFDLLVQLDGVEEIALVATEAVLATGWFERAHDLLPGLDVVEWHEPRDEFARQFDTPRLLVGQGPGPYFVSRDREEEMRDLVRRLRALHHDPHTRVRLDRIGVVFDRPLPYIYLAREIFTEGGVPFDARDALPLGSEPPAAALNLALGAVASAFSRGSLAALLSSPLFTFAAAPGDAPVSRLHVADLEAAIEEADPRGDPDALDRLAVSWLDGTGRSRFARWDPQRAAHAARAAAAAIRELLPLASPAPASEQLARLGAFVRTHRRVVRDDDPLRERLLRAEEALLAIIDALASAHRAHHDLLWDHGDLAADLRHHIEQHTFAPDTGASGVQLVDAVAAPFGDFDALHVVGLVDGDWPRRQRRNIFYSQGLLSTLGWPPDSADQVAPARAAFTDLLQSPTAYASVSTFTLEDDALVEPSSLLDDIGRAGLTPIVLDLPAVRVFEDEALMAGTGAGAGRHAEAAAWVTLRAGRLAPGLPRFHGDAGPQRPRARSVSAYRPVWRSARSSSTRDTCFGFRKSATTTTD